MDEEERKQQQEQLSQILFEDDEESDNEAKQKQRNPNKREERVEEALQDARIAANSFAENVMAEHQRDRESLHNMSQDGNQEIEGLIGTFAKPNQGAKTLTQVPSLNLQSDLGNQRH